MPGRARIIPRVPGFPQGVDAARGAGIVQEALAGKAGGAAAGDSSPAGDAPTAGAAPTLPGLPKRWGSASAAPSEHPTSGASSVPDGRLHRRRPDHAA
jgi:hypothetical protein